MLFSFPEALEVKFLFTGMVLFIIRNLGRLSSSSLIAGAGLQEFDECHTLLDPGPGTVDQTLDHSLCSLPVPVSMPGAHLVVCASTLRDEHIAAGKLGCTQWFTARP